MTKELDKWSYWSSLSKFEKHAGKALIGTALGVTILGIANSVHITKKPSKTKASDVIDG